MIVLINRSQQFIRATSKENSRMKKICYLNPLIEGDVFSPRSQREPDSPECRAASN